MAAGERFEAGVRLALEAVLVSPHFLFRIERWRGRPARADAKDLATRAGLAAVVLPVEQPSRTSRSRRWPQKGEARQALELQVRRMLADPRARRWSRTSPGSGWKLRRLDDVRRPTRHASRASTRPCARRLRREAELFFEAIVQEDRSVLNFSTPTSPSSTGASRSTTASRRRGRGLLQRVGCPTARVAACSTLASVLTVTSNPTRTSPVKRGKWVLENLLDVPPRPPPPGADSLDEVAVTASAATLRESMEKHRARPDCAACHVRMDALGFALERYDPVGRLRLEHGGKPVDARGLLPDGRSVEGLGGWRAPLLEDGAFLRCLARKLFTFALGRAPEPRDELQLFALTERLRAGSPTIDDLIVAIVRLDAFRKRAPGE